MNILSIINFILICCVGVFLYNQIKEREDEIEELYNLYFLNKEKDFNKNKKGKVIKIDKRIF